MRKSPAVRGVSRNLRASGGNTLVLTREGPGWLVAIEKGPDLSRNIGPRKDETPETCWYWRVSQDRVDLVETLRAGNRFKPQVRRWGFPYQSGVTMLWNDRGPAGDRENPL